MFYFGIPLALLTGFTGSFVAAGLVERMFPILYSSGRAISLRMMVVCAAICAPCGVVSYHLITTA